MSAEVVLQRLRRFLLILAGLMCLATVVELGFEKHWENPIQVLPFVLCGAGLIAVTLLLAQPTRVSVHILRWTMGIIFVGGLWNLRWKFTPTPQPANCSSMRLVAPTRCLRRAF